MARNWYIVHVFAGYEQKINRTLSEMIAENKIDSSVLIQVKVPTEEITEVRNNKKYTKNSLLLPGYIMVEMDLPQIGWKDVCSQIRRVQGVTGFVGTSPSERPRPITAEEAKRMLQAAGELKGDRTVKIKQSYEVGDKVKITEGPFATFSGSVEEVMAEKNKLRVSVQIFGRVTPVEVDVLQVEKI